MNFTKGKARFEILAEKKRQKYAGRPVIEENVDHGRWLAGSKAKEWPVGATWVASLGIVYGV